MTKARDLANGGFGLVLVKPSSVVGGTDNGKGTVSFSAASSVSLNDVFSTTYNKYKILLDVQCSATPEIRFRLRSSGSDNSTSNYYFTGFYSFSSDTTIGNDNLYKGDPDTAWAIGIGGNNQTAINVDLVSPFLSTYTSFVAQSGCMVNTNEAYSLNTNGGFAGTTSFTGFTLIPSTGTITGTVSVYGYNN
jgi:hypothetical protein